ncbi:Tudor domain-containing [Trichinella pseudospiralis]
MDDNLQCFDPIYLEEETEDEGEKIEFLEDGNWDNVDENTLGSLKSQAQAEDVGSTKKALVIESCDLSSTVNAFLDCIIIKADHPDCFFIRLEHQDTESMMSEIRAELEEMTNNGESIVACPAVGQYCIAKSEAGYQRAKVLKLQQINGVAYAQMLYVDLGKVEWINYNSVVTLPNAFYGIPSVAIRCMLYGVKPKGKDWSKSAMECFFNFTAENSGKKYLIRPREIVPLNGNLITKVDLFRRNLNEKESVGDCLLQLDDVEIGDREIDFSDRIIEEELENISPPVENKENPQSLNIPFSSSLNTNYHFILPTVSKTIITLRNSDLKPNENDFSSANLFVSYISHSGCAYIRWLNGIHDAVDLNMIESRLEQIYCDWKPRRSYMLCIEYTLNRKPVLTVEKVMVYLIDHGTSRSVFVDELYLIEKSLYDIPICTYEYSWVDVLSQSESEFSKCCSERALKNYRYLKKRKNYFDHQSDITSDRFVDISAGTTA